MLHYSILYVQELCIRWVIVTDLSSVHGVNKIKLTEILYTHTHTHTHTQGVLKKKAKLLL